MLRFSKIRLEKQSAAASWNNRESL